MKDSKGHGSNKRGQLGPSNKDAIGHFLKALAGVHRNVPGHGEVPTGQGVPPVVRHSNTKSVGTETLAEVSAAEATQFNSKS
ncbi:MAG: hypothetical protein ABSA90_06960 [Xanthobacteraceae bacterium]|jgi:hypothetical protein